MERAGVATWTLCKVIFKSEQFKRDENGMKNKITIIQLSYKRYERHFTQQENKQSSQAHTEYSKTYNQKELNSFKYILWPQLWRTDLGKRKVSRETLKFQMWLPCSSEHMLAINC